MFSCNLPGHKAWVSALGLAAWLVPASAQAQSLIPGGGFSGPYIGLTGGGAWADVQGASKSSDLIWTGHAGYGIQWTTLYLGGEIDGTWGGSRSTSNLSPLYQSTLEVDWTATARARLGIVAGGALLYGTAGVVWSGQTLGVHELGNALSSSSRTVPGAVYGAGIELKLAPFVSARLEALHFDYSAQSDRFSDAIRVGISPASWKSIDLDETVVRAGISLRFN